MKKKILIIVGSVLLFAALVFGGCYLFKDKGNLSKNGNTNSQTIEETLEDNTTKKQNDLVISDVNIREFGATNIASGKIQNTKNVARKIKVTLKMFNTQTGKTLGLNNVVVDLAASETKDFEVGIMGDYTTVDTYEILTEDVK